MTISPIKLKGSIQKNHNVLHKQHREMEKGMVDHGNIQVEEEKRDQQMAKQVVQADETLIKEERFDAKERRRNGYAKDGGKRRKKAKEDGKVDEKSEGGYDMKI